MPLARLTNPSFSEPTARTPVKPTSVPQPYTPAEIEQIEVWMNYVANAATNTANKQLLVSLCLGAGLRAKEASLLTWDRVYADATGVMLLDVSGRDVPVRQIYSEPLIHGLSNFRPDQYVLAPTSHKSNRSNIESSISTMYRSRGLAPKPARLRVTWIQHFMNAGVNDELICLAAGTTTLRCYSNLRDNVEYSPDTIRSWFHGSDRGLNVV